MKKIVLFIIFCSYNIFGQPVYSLLESFNSPTFPPNGWSVIYTGTNYWHRDTMSGFGLGSGCAEYDMWNAQSGTTQSLVSPVFTPTESGDSVQFDIAYCPYFTAMDSLVIMLAIDSTYFTFVRLGPSQMQSVMYCNHHFIPGAADWKRMSFSLPLNVNRIKFVGISDYGDSFYLDSIGVFIGMINGINPESTQQPISYVLYQNYPNPFNPSSRIKFQIAKLGEVQLKIFDILGREVATLVNEKLNPGTYEVEWDGSNYPSGVYFYNLISNSFNQTKRMVLLK